MIYELWDKEKGKENKQTNNVFYEYWNLKSGKIKSLKLPVNVYQDLDKGNNIPHRLKSLS